MISLKQKKQSTSQKSHESGAGFTIIELIATISILSFGIIGIYSAFSFTYTLTYNISARLTAAYLAQEGFEVVRNIRDYNFISSPLAAWSDGLTGCEIGCQLDYKTGTSTEGSADVLQEYIPDNLLNLDSDGFYSYGIGTPTRFRRRVTISQESGNDSLKVVVLVTWDYRGKVSTFEASGYLYNWY